MHQPTLFSLEIWKPVVIDGYEGLYQVSSYGRVRSMARTIRASNRVVNYKTRILRQNIDSGGYAQVTLCNETKRRTVGVHVLVAQAFLGPNPGGMEVCHGDGNATHNHPHNLRWDTRSSNVVDKTRHGTHNFLKSYTPRDRSTIRSRAKKSLQMFVEGECVLSATT